MPKEISLVSQEEQIASWERMKNRQRPDHPVVCAFAKPKLDFIRESLDWRDNTRPTMLEVGCGSGYFSLALTEEYNLTYIKFSKNMLNMNPISWKREVVGNAVSVDIEDNSFDIVFAETCYTTLNILSERSPR